MRRVLLIDGSPKLLQALRNALEHEGYETIRESFTRVEDAHRIIPLKPNLIILDIVTGLGQNIGWKLLKNSSSHRIRNRYRSFSRPQISRK